MLQINHQEIMQMSESEFGSYIISVDMGTPLYENLARNLSDYLAAVFGVQDNPKRKVLFEKAYELGHSAGTYEVYLYYSDLVELIR